MLANIGLNGALFFLLASLVDWGESMELTLLEGSRGKCNDGSNPGFYYRKGNSSNWVIYLEGGGYCFDEVSCSLRWVSNPEWMSSKPWATQKTGSGILSPDSNINPYWYNANAIDIMYCSSDHHSGNNNSALGWAFLGSHIIEDVVNYAIQELDLLSADQVIFTGSSAGAVGLYPNSNRIAKLLGNIKFLVVLDSGWFLDFDPYKMGDCKTLGSCTEKQGLIRAVPHWNPRVDESCAATKQPDTLWQCLLSYHAYPFIRPPTFVFVFSYDAAALGNDGIYTIPSTPAELKYANEARHNISVTLTMDHVPAYFNPTCYCHTIEGNDNWLKLQVNGKRYPDVLYGWTNNPTELVQVRDSCAGPECNPTCDLLVNCYRPSPPTPAMYFSVGNK